MIRHIFLDKTATILKDSPVNTGLNPVAELNYGDAVTRIILHFDESKIKDMVNDKTIADLDKTTFTLKMTNCTAINGVPYGKKLYFGNTNTVKERASSFVVLAMELPQSFDEGRGFEFIDDTWITNKNSYSSSGCNWYQSNNGRDWPNPGVYSTDEIADEYEKFSNGEKSKVIARQKFDFGDEQLNMDITDYVKELLDESGTTKNYGIMLCFSPVFEVLNGGWLFRQIDKLEIPEDEDFDELKQFPSKYDVKLKKYFSVETETVEYDDCGDKIATTTTVTYYTRFKQPITTQQYVGFFTDHTNTFFHPYIEIDYKEYVQDDRECFYTNKQNRLYLYSNINGKPENLDNPPTCSIDIDDISISLTGIQATKGVYYVEVPKQGFESNEVYYDVWKNIVYKEENLYINKNGEDVGVELEFATLPGSGYIQIGSSDVKHEHLVPQVYGINDDENVTRNEIREVGVDFRKKYTTNERETISEAYYRLYVKDGNKQIDILNGYQPIERSFLHNYFLLYTGELIPNNKYYVDIKFRDGREERFYENVLHFNIVDDITERYA